MPELRYTVSATLRDIADDSELNELIKEIRAINPYYKHLGAYTIVRDALEALAEPYREDR